MAMVFQVMNQADIYDFLHELTYTAGQSYGSVAGNSFRRFSRFGKGEDSRRSPGRWVHTLRQDSVENSKKERDSSIMAVFEELIVNLVWSRRSVSTLAQHTLQFKSRYGAVIVIFMVCSKINISVLTPLLDPEKDICVAVTATDRCIVVSQQCCNLIRGTDRIRATHQERCAARLVFPYHLLYPLPDLRHRGVSV
jgi:hypothetical protein